MNNSAKTGKVGAQKAVSMGFVRWTTIYFAGWAACQAVFLAFVALALDVRIRSLGLPYLLLVWCGYAGGVLIYWGRQRPVQSMSAPVRFALAIFLFMNLYMGALVFGAYRIDLLSREAALYGYAPYILPGAALTSILVYFMARRRLEAFRGYSAGAGS